MVGGVPAVLGGVSVVATYRYIPPSRGEQKKPDSQIFNHRIYYSFFREPDHHDTSTKAEVQGAIKFCERMNIPYFNGMITLRRG